MIRWRWANAFDLTVDVTIGTGASVLDPFGLPSQICGATAAAEATCYMNSLLQSLFNIPEFRMAVYQFAPWPGKHIENVAKETKRCGCQLLH